MSESQNIEWKQSRGISRPRKPLIADVCFKAGYIDSWGRGTIKIFEACREAGLPEPEITSLDGGILVTLHKQVADLVADLVTDLVTDPVKSLIAIMDQEYSISELMSFMNLTHKPNFRKNYLQPALESGLIEITIPDKPSSSKQKYRLTSKGKSIKTT